MTHKSELDHDEFLVGCVLSAHDADVADDGKHKANEIGADHAGEEESVPLAVGFEVGHSSSVLSCIPREYAWEENFVLCIESNSAKSRECSEKKTETLSSVLLVNKA